MAKDYKYLVARTGRPTKFRKEFIAQMIEFFDIEPTKKELMEEVREIGRDGKERKVAAKYKHVPNKFPTLIQFAKHIKVSYWSLMRWAELGEDHNIQAKLAKNQGLTPKEVEMMKDLAEFCTTYKACKDLQQDFLMQNGLNGASPSAGYIFTAKNVTKMRDKVENDITVKQVKPLLENLKPNYVHDNNSDEESSSTDEKN